MDHTRGADTTGGSRGSHPGGEGSELPVTPTAAGAPLWPASALGCPRGVLSRPRGVLSRNSQWTDHPARRRPSTPKACPHPAPALSPPLSEGPHPANLRCQLAPTRGPGTLSSVTPKERCVAAADGRGGVNSEGRVSGTRQRSSQVQSAHSCFMSAENTCSAQFGDALGTVGPHAA